MISQHSQGEAEYLEQQFLIFAKKLLSQLQIWITAGENSQIARIKADFTDKGTYSKMETINEYGALVDSHYYSSIRHMEELEQCARSHWEAGVVYLSWLNPEPEQKVSFEEAYDSLTYSLLLPVLRTAKQCNTLSPTDEQILEQYRTIKSQWSSTTIRMEITFPLLNFTSDLQREWQCGAFLRLAPFSLEQKDAVWNAGEFIFDYAIMNLTKPIDLAQFSEASFCVSGAYDHPKSLDHEERSKAPLQTIWNELHIFLTALRLLKDGDIGAPAHFQKIQISSWSHSTEVLWMRSDYRTRQHPYMRRQYIFYEQDIPAAEQLIEALQKLKPQKQGYTQRPYYGDLTVALRRFHQSYSREIPEDQVIDLAIALDSSLFDQKDTELKYRFSLRGAAILTMAKVANWTARKSQFFLNVMYDVRSAIVHNGMQITDLEKTLHKLERVGLEPRHFLLYCEDIVREILKAYVIQLAKGRSKRTVIENLDLYVVEGMEAQSHLETDENS